MNSDKLLKMATFFEKMAQSEPEKIDIRDKIFHEAIKPNYEWSFAQVADVLFSKLKEKEPGLQDAGASQGPVYKLMTMINAHAIPSAAELLDLSQKVSEKTKILFPPPSSEYNIARHLVQYALLIIKKYLSGVSGKDNSSPLSVNNESSAIQSNPSENNFQFISRVYKQLRSGQSISDLDKQKWNSTVKNVATLRFNGLNGISNRTPVQEQEFKVLQTLINQIK
jgi:hypothetical protein